MTLEVKSEMIRAGEGVSTVATEERFGARVLAVVTCELV